MANKPFLTMKTRLPKTPEAIAKLGVSEGGDVQRYATDQIFDRIRPYMPYKTGELRGTAFVKTTTKIRVWARHARAQFFGVTKDGRPFNYNRNGNPKAGSHWDKRLMNDEGAAIAADISKYAKSRTGKAARK